MEKHTMIEENERATDETDDAPSLKPWSKPRIKTLYIIGTKTGTKTHTSPSMKILLSVFPTIHESIIHRGVESAGSNTRKSKRARISLNRN